MRGVYQHKVEEQALCNHRCGIDVPAEGNEEREGSGKKE